MKRGHRALIAGLRQPLGPGGDAQPQQPLALRDHARDPRPRRPRGLRQGCEIDMGGQIGLAGMGKGVLGHMVAQGLKRVAPALPVAVINGDGQPAMVRDAAGDLGA